MSDIGEGMIVIGQLAQDWKKGDFSRGCRGCGTCGCFIVFAILTLTLSLLLVGFLVYRSSKPT